MALYIDIDFAIITSQQQEKMDRKILVAGKKRYCYFELYFLKTYIYKNCNDILCFIMMKFQQNLDEIPRSIPFDTYDSYTDWFGW